MRAKRIDCQRKWRDLTVYNWLLNQQRLAAIWLFHFAVGQFGDFQLRAEWFGHAPQLSGSFELGDKITKRIESHTRRLAKRFPCAAGKRSLEMTRRWVEL